jgi:hypothetical protein
MNHNAIPMASDFFNSLLGLFASVSALAVVPAATRAASLEVDPIFAAIKRHNEVLRAFRDTCPRIDENVAESEGRTSPKRTKPPGQRRSKLSRQPSKRS